MKRFWSVICLVAVLLVPASVAVGSEASTSPNQDLWYPTADEGSTGVSFYFVYSETCPHCAHAKPWVDHIEETYSWIDVRRISTQAATDQEINEVLALADEVGVEIQGVPAFLFCERVEVGFDTWETTGAIHEDTLVECHERVAGPPEDTTEPGPAEPEDTEEEDSLHLPVLGEIYASAVSLPVFTVAVAGLDAFNPCAFFVLLFLLSLLVHARSRWRMALVGGVFVVISGVM